MYQLLEEDERDDADNEVDDADGQQQPHPRPDGSEMWLVDRVEVLQTLESQLHLYVADPRVCHSQDDDQQRDDCLDNGVRHVNVLHAFDVTQVQRFLCMIQQSIV